jgi:hypothetical protein
VSSDAWARGILLQAFAAEGIPAPSAAVIQTVQAQCRGEGAYGLATKPPGWELLHNWGGVHSKELPPCDVGNLEIHDNGRQVCAKGYETDLDGARAVLRIIRKVIPSFESGDLAVSAAAIQTKYHYTADIDNDKGTSYTDMLWNNAKVLAKNIGEPLAVRRGGRGIPDSGKGKKVDTDAIRGYLSEVSQKWAATNREVQDRYADAMTGQGARLPFSRLDFLDDYAAFSRWYLAAINVTFYISDSVYDEGRRWDQKCEGYRIAMGVKPLPLAPPVPKTAAEQAPGIIPPLVGPGDSIFGGSGTMMMMGLLVVGAVVISRK